MNNNNYSTAIQPSCQDKSCDSAVIFRSESVVVFTGLFTAILLVPSVGFAECAVVTGVADTNIVCTAGPESVTLSDGSVDNIYLGATNGLTEYGNDLTIDGGQVNGVILGDAGANTRLFSSGSVEGNIIAHGGTDDITVGGGVLTGRFHLGSANATTSGDDQFTISSGSVGGVVGDLGADTFTLSGGTIVQDVDGKGGNDIINL